MSSYVENLIGHFVQIISIEGRIFIGELNSYDQLMNIVLKNCIERIFSIDKGVREEKMGLYMLRGDNVAIISEYNLNKEKLTDYSNIKSNKLKEFLNYD
jgi:U6 snRNA-associated Sm-like protein LSm8